MNELRKHRKIRAIARFDVPCLMDEPISNAETMEDLMSSGYWESNKLDSGVTETTQTLPTLAKAGWPQPGNGVGLLRFRTEDCMCVTNENGKDNAGEVALAVKQSMKYAEDIAQIYEEEKTKRKALEQLNRKLAQEVTARRQAEQQLRESQKLLEVRVYERTKELRNAVKMLQSEVEQRRKAETVVSASLKEKKVLLQEIHHRVKNNLQIICSLISLQSKRIKDEMILGALQDTESRIKSMALIHEQLYRSDDFSRIDIAAYVERLIDAITPHHLKRSEAIEIITELDQVSLTVGTALPCSLLINELVTNCLKHAFPNGQSGRIKVEFHKIPGNRYRIVVADNGVGLPTDLDLHKTKSLGLQLVANLAELQLRGNIDLSVNNGTIVTIEFSDIEEK
jgi:two-component sensor histidine kinase